MRVPPSTGASSRRCRAVDVFAFTPPMSHGLCRKCKKDLLNGTSDSPPYRFRAVSSCSAGSYAYGRSSISHSCSRHVWHFANAVLESGRQFV
jgi:hypothetical protein